jgi:hypothetical protein
MKAISIRGPWWWMILNIGKTIENRDWPTSQRGRVLIHASKGMTRDEYYSAADFAMAAVSNEYRGRGIVMPSWRQMPRGGIVGSVEIVDCVLESDNPWFMGRYGFVLRDPVVLPFREFRGQLGFFDVPDEYGRAA